MASLGAALLNCASELAMVILLVITNSHSHSAACFHGALILVNLETHYTALSLITHRSQNKMADVCRQHLKKCVPGDTIDDKSYVVQVMLWRRKCDKPLPGPVMITFYDAV